METVITAADIQVQEADGQVQITFKPDSVGRVSSSGRSMVVASTGGFIKAGPYKVNINVIQTAR